MAGFTLTQLEALERAIASGKLKVRYEGKEVQYQSLDEMMRARKTIREELGDMGLLPSAPSHGGATLGVFYRD